MTNNQFISKGAEKTAPFLIFHRICNTFVTLALLQYYKYLYLHICFSTFEEKSRISTVLQQEAFMDINAAPRIFLLLQSSEYIRTDDLVCTQDGFWLVCKSMSEILAQ